MFGQEVEGSDSCNHLAETGDFTYFVDAFAVVVQKFAVLALPHAPTLGADLGHALVVAEQVQEVAKIP